MLTVFSHSVVMQDITFFDQRTAAVYCGRSVVMEPHCFFSTFYFVSDEDSGIVNNILVCVNVVLFVMLNSVHNYVHVCSEKSVNDTCLILYIAIENNQVLSSVLSDCVINQWDILMNSFSILDL